MEPKLNYSPLSICLWQSSSGSCRLGKYVPYVVRSSSNQRGCGVLTRDFIIPWDVLELSTPNPYLAMVKEDYFCASCRERLSQNYSSLRSYAVKNRYPVHRTIVMFGTFSTLSRIGVLLWNSMEVSKCRLPRYMHVCKEIRRLKKRGARCILI